MHYTIQGVLAFPPSWTFYIYLAQDDDEGKRKLLHMAYILGNHRATYILRLDRPDPYRCSIEANRIGPPVVEGGWN